MARRPTYKELEEKIRQIEEECPKGKQAETVLRASEERYRMLAQMSVDGVWRVDFVPPISVHLSEREQVELILDRGQVAECNDAIVRQFGYEQPEEMIGHPLADFIAPTHEEGIETVTQFVRSGYRVVHRETRRSTKNGQLRWVFANAFGIVQNGALAFAWGVQHDITDRKRAEEELQVSEAKFRALSENAPAVIFIIQGDKIRYANPAMEVITGFTRQELLEMNFWDYVHPDFRDLVRERGLARQRGEPVPVRYEFKIVTKGGEERWVDFTDGKFELDGKLAVIGMVLDVTERKRMEQALRTTTEQLRALAVKFESVREEEGRRIARELHDEIGSAMTSLKWDLEGLNQLCSEVSGHIDYSALRERIGGMVELIDTTGSTVQKISSELRPAVLDDLGLIAAIEYQAQQFTARTGIVCQFDSFVESIDLDREKATVVFRIVQEALTNILRHSQATRVDILIERENDELVVEVKDNGRGITESERTGASSLGLIGMQERAHLVRGKIEIAGFPGKGTALTVRVPVFNEASG